MRIFLVCRNKKGSIGRCLEWMQRAQFRRRYWWAPPKPCFSYVEHLDSKALDNGDDESRAKAETLGPVVNTSKKKGTFFTEFGLRWRPLLSAISLIYSSFRPNRPCIRLAAFYYKKKKKKRKTESWSKHKKRHQVVSVCPFLLGFIFFLFVWVCKFCWRSWVIVVHTTRRCCRSHGHSRWM